ncbi:hypothetical protein D3C87_1861350 [compost metagenome]
MTVPSSSHVLAIAVSTPGVFQVVALIVRSRAGTLSRGAAMKPTRKPVATLLDNPDT